MINDILVGGTGLRESIQLIHVVHVTPQRRQLSGNLKIDKIFAGDSDMLKTWHELAIEAAHRVTSEKTSVLLGEVLVDLAKMRQQSGGFYLIFFYQS